MSISEPRHLTGDSIRRVVVGDQQTGFFTDWVLADDEASFVNVFAVPPGAGRHLAPQHSYVSRSDQVLYVLDGEMVLADPTTGEVHRVTAGQATFLRPGTWHKLINLGEITLRGLEFVFPPQGTGQPTPEAPPSPRWARDDLLGRWPAGREAVQESIAVVREADLLWRMEGTDSPLLVGLLVSTEHATVGKLHCAAGQRTDVQRRGADTVIYLESGRLHVELAVSGRFFELAPGEGVQLPAGTEHRLFNPGLDRAVGLFSVAGDYLPR